MEHQLKIKHLFLPLLFFSLSQVYAAQQPLVYDKEPVQNRGPQFRTLSSNISEHRVVRSRDMSTELSDAIRPQGMPDTDRQSMHEYTIELENPHTLVGKAKLTLAQSVPVSQTNPLYAYILVQRNQNWVCVSRDTFDLDGSLETEFGGQYTGQVKILVPAEASTDSPLASAQVGEIVHAGTIRIMPIGDSVTYGEYDGAGPGLRKRLYDRLIADGYDIDFVGSWGDPPYEGHFRPSRKIDDFYPPDLLGGDMGRMDITNPFNTYRPNMVAIHLGTNDLNSQWKAVGPYEENGEIQNTQSGEVAVLINYMLKWHNGEFGTDLNTIIISMIIPMEDTTNGGINPDCVEFNLEVARLARDFRNGVITGQPEPVYICDQFDRIAENPYLFNDTYLDPMFDMLHPTKEGLETMGEEYYKVFKYVLDGEYQWFREITWDAGVGGFPDIYFDYKGVSINDITQDGLEDIYLSRNAKGYAQPREAFYTSNQELPYTESAFDYNIADEEKSMGTVFVDIDNDGDFDLFNGNSNFHNRLYRNVDNQDFEEITAQAGISSTIRSTTATLAFDSENDGDMDILAINTEQVNEFYINDGNGNFSIQDHGLQEVDEPDKFSLSASAADFDNDGDTDIFLSKRSDYNRLWLNDGSGNYTDVAEQAGVKLSYTKYACNGANWADLDNDGDLDLIIGSLKTSQNPNPLLIVFENQGDGTFSNISETVGIPMSGYAPIIADFDNDGDEDIISTNISSLTALYVNQGNWNFTLQANSGSEIYAGDIRGGAPFDYDNDGDLDFIVTRADAFNIMMQNNISNGNNWLRIKAYGPDGNIGGFGTKIWIYEPGYIDDPAHLLVYRQVISANGFVSQYSPVQHVGMGTRSQCDLLARFTDGTMIVMRNVNVNQTITIRPELPQNTGSDPALIAEYSGNQQEATVGETLDNPVVVKVTDDEGRPVEGANVTFQVTQGDATLFIPDLSSDAISVETETGQLSGNMQWYYDYTAAGNGFVSVPSYLGGTGSASMQVEISQADEFSAWVRYANATPSDVISLTIGNSSPATPQLEQQDGWQWVQLSNNSVPALYELSQGAHTITLNITQGRPHIDKILLTTDPNYVPTGAEEGGSESPNLTDREGLARRFVEFNQTAGPVVIEASLSHNSSPVSGSPVRFDLTALPGPPVSITKTSGDGQAGEVNVPLDAPFVVTIQDAFSNPIPDYEVVFLVTSGGGVMDNNAVTTDSQGQAGATLTPGGDSSVQQVQAIAQNVPGSPVTFTAAIRGVASDMEFVSGSNQTGKVMHFLSAPVKVKVLEESGNPAVAFPVRFSVFADTGGVMDQETYDLYQGGSSVNADSSKQILTDLNGIATAWWQLGTNTGEQSLRIDAGNINGSPLNVKATAQADDPAVIIMISGNNQTAPVRQNLAQPLTVRINDQFGNPISGHSVTFKATNGGAFDGNTQTVAVTNTNGNAYAVFTTGTIAGTDVYQIQASATYGGNAIPGSPMVFNASATAGSAAIAVKVSGDAQTDTVGQSLIEPFKVKVTDAYNNPVSGYQVRFLTQSGKGAFYGQEIYNVNTSNSGIASAIFTLDESAGVNQAQAFFDGLSPQTIDFTATGVHDKPAQLLYVSGNDQSGVRGTRLAQPFQVRVTDQYENPVQNHPVLYEVTSELGSIEGLNTYSAQTDESGLARAYLTLGEELGDSNHVVKVSSEYISHALSGSPITFYASVRRGNPARIVPITSTNGLLGAPGQILPDTLFVKIVDADNLPIPDFTVQFAVLTGSGTFTANNQATLSANTDTRGIASAVWRLGNIADEQRISVSAIYENEHLEQSPLYFTAYAVSSGAQSLSYESGNNQTGKVGQPLANPFAVLVKDQLDFPVSNHPVTFSVTTGTGTIGTATDTLVRTDNNGIARATLTLGGELGANTQKVTVKSSNQGVALTGSPVVFQASGQTGLTDAVLSKITAASPVPASGTHFSTISVVLKDKFGNLLSGRTVTLESSGLNANISPSSGVTNSSGAFSAQANSSVAGTVTVRATADGVALDQPAQITFFSTNAEKISRVSDSNVIAYPASWLAEPLAVKVTDNNDSAVPNFPVTFSASDPDTKLEAEQPVMTDANGIAQTNIRVTSQPAELTVEAVAGGLQGSPLAFNIYVMMPENLTINKTSGDGQSGTLGQTLSLPLRVRINDNDGRPAGNLGVLFTSTNTDIALPDSGTVKTGPDGYAQTTVSMGTHSGQTQITARMVGTAKTVSFTVYATSDQASDLVAASNQTPIMGLNTQLSQPLSVKVSDNAGNGVANRQVKFGRKSGPGQFVGDSVKTSSATGVASVNFASSTVSGTAIIFATSTAVPQDTVWFYVKINPANPQVLQIADGNLQTGIAGHLLNQKLDVKVTDSFGNGVPGVTVTFRATSGNGTVLPDSVSVSDSTGHARVYWILGSTRNSQTVTAIKNGLTNSPLSFTATVLNNSAPVITFSTSDLETAENDTLKFTVQVTDAENDHFTVSVMNLPEGATFDANGQRKFFWIPGYQQAGSYPVKFTATDTLNAMSEKYAFITVSNANRAPRIVMDESVPTELNLGSLTKGQYIDFYVKAVDDDGDALNYVWLVNDQAKASQASFRLQTQNYDLGGLVVKALVFDQSDTASATWQGQIITAIELKHFSGVFKDYDGVKLDWSTRREIDNLGFYIQRATRPEGPYTEISGLVPSNEKGEYSYSDTDVKAGKVYYYRLEDMQTDGIRNTHDMITVEPPLPKAFTLHQNYPNPFNPTTKVRFETPEVSQVSLIVYDILGREVKILIKGELDPGYHSTSWDGTNAQDLQVAAGVYYMVLNTSKGRFVKKMALVK